MTALITTWRGPVQHDWVDYNGHLRDAFYLLLFSFATDGLMDQIGLDEAGRKSTGHSLFTLECHLNYLLEVKEGAMVEVRTQILGHDNKRLHLFHTLHLADKEEALATNEQMLLNVELAAPRSAKFADSVLQKLQALMAQHADLPRSKYVGRTMALPG